MVRITLPTLRIAALAIITFKAAVAQQSLEWPFGQRSDLPSPNGQHIVYGKPFRSSTSEGPELWLRHRGWGERKRLLSLGTTAQAFWFPDSRNFLVIDRESSSGMTSYIYDLKGDIVLDMRASLLQHDPELGAVADGHFYVEAQRLLDTHTVRVAAFGHTDGVPVRCFRFIYKIDRDGKIERISKRISLATASFCDELSE